MYRIVTGVGPHPTPLTVTRAPEGSEVICNSPSVESAAATLPVVSVCAGVGVCGGETAGSTASVAVTSAIAGASASGVGALAAITGEGAAGVVVPARYHAVAIAAATARMTTAAALDHHAAANGDDPASPGGWATTSTLCTSTSTPVDTPARSRIVSSTLRPTATAY